MNSRPEVPAKNHGGPPIAMMERWHPFGLSTTDRWEPFRVSDIQSKVNRLFDNFFGRPATTTGRAWVPPVDMYATQGRPRPDARAAWRERKGRHRVDHGRPAHGQRRAAIRESGQGAGAPPRRADLREVRAADQAADGRAG